MTDKLSDRIEAASAGSRELDAEIAVAASHPIQAKFDIGYYSDGSGPKVTVRYDATPPPAHQTWDCSDMIWLETGGAEWIAFDHDVADDVCDAIQRSAAALRARGL